MEIFRHENLVWWFKIKDPLVKNIKVQLEPIIIINKNVGELIINNNGNTELEN